VIFAKWLVKSVFTRLCFNALLPENVNADLKMLCQVDHPLYFAQESNSLDSVMRHKKLPVRGLEKVQIFAVMADIFRLIKEMLEHIRQTQISKLRDKLLKEAYQQQLTLRWVA
jgi:hypothetical protein